MPFFPESRRVFYAKNPLEEVICQVRFPPVLRIDTEAPAEFQERIRKDFPLYRQAPAMVVPDGMPLPPQILQLLSQQASSSHEFESQDQTWKLVLNREFLALTTKRYESWQEFRGRLETPLAALGDIYQPAFFSRLGLRYRDRIDREKLGLANVPWRELFRREPLGELGDEDVGSHVVSILREVVVSLEEDAGRVRVVHGLRSDPALVYVIDCDFFTEVQVPIGGALDVLERFNRKAFRLFRWYISDRLHHAMDPRDAA